ncbi:restriction endonuclease subunit S [Micromonospora sp. BQ11]|uniref:restriction endonuclease subunit S n=1 Tax=Micromonospora sp. BQ11 TaxID=3452212 RepID=UPI003F88C59E
MSAPWKPKRLGSFYDVRDERAGLSADSLPLMSVSQMHGVIPRSELYGDDGRAETLVNYKICEPGDIVLNRMSAYNGAVGVARQRGLVSPDYLVMQPREGVNADFVVAWLKTPRGIYEMTSRLRGIGSADAAQVRTPRINESDLRLIPVEAPLPEEQRAIADYLKRETARIDILIEEQQHLIQLLRERRHAVVDRAIRRGVVNARMTDSGDPLVGEVPEGWSVVPIRRVAASLDSRRIPLSSEQRAERTGPIPYYGATSVIDHVDDFIFDEPLVLVAEDGFGLLYRSKPIAVHVEGRIWVNNHAHVLRPLGVPAHLLAARIESENLVPYLAGSRQPKLTAEALMGMRISIPPEDQWSQILAVLDNETAKIDTLIAETERFVELARERRAALITAVVTGQIDVREMA